MIRKMSHEMEMRSWGENPKHEDQKYYCVLLPCNMNQGMQTKLLTIENESLVKLSVCFENMHACLQIKRLTRGAFPFTNAKVFCQHFSTVHGPRKGRVSTGTAREKALMKWQTKMTWRNAKEKTTRA